MVNVGSSGFFSRLESETRQPWAVEGPPAPGTSGVGTTMAGVRGGGRGAAPPAGSGASAGGIRVAGYFHVARGGGDPERASGRQGRRAPPPPARLPRRGWSALPPPDLANTARAWAAGRKATSAHPGAAALDARLAPALRSAWNFISASKELVDPWSSHLGDPLAADPRLVPSVQRCCRVGEGPRGQSSRGPEPACHLRRELVTGEGAAGRHGREVGYGLEQRAGRKEQFIGFLRVSGCRARAE